MTKEHIQEQVADALRGAADKIDPRLNEVSEPPKPETTEAAQEAHQSALTSFQTERKDGMCLSLNGAPLTEAQISERVESGHKQDE